jgi:hypothetical protein
MCSGQRVATFMLFLNTPTATAGAAAADAPIGGQTHFPKAEWDRSIGSGGASGAHRSRGLLIEPRAGRAVLWFNVLPQYRRDSTSSSGGSGGRDNRTDSQRAPQTVPAAHAADESAADALTGIRVRTRFNPFGFTATNPTAARSVESMTRTAQADWAIDATTVHAGLPLRRGSGADKWILTKWIRQDEHRLQLEEEREDA